VIATGFGQVHTPKQFGAKLTSQPDSKRPSPAYPSYVEPKVIVEPYKDMGFDRPAAPPERITAAERPAPLPPERLAPPERVVGFQDRIIDRTPKAEETPPARAPFARPAPGPVPGKAGFGHVAPAPRDDENRVLFNDAADPSRKFGATPQPPQKGRYKDLDPDIDYETPAFLRNQAD
jgi:hypothetical protein